MKVPPTVQDNGLAMKEQKELSLLLTKRLLPGQLLLRGRLAEELLLSELLLRAEPSATEYPGLPGIQERLENRKNPGLWSSHT
ncbi:hypothetical protein Y1Q_0017466 [Alligator mississippiensis]|uniref:Uncharacterized protein n=1 Tax=Alligator mississippiensis TaxID=8496 RepID=A0A151P2G5_ALLMI|nr:hypothetical protein Y1Q_0017466 [Alligator mississippiensis]